METQNLSAAEIERMRDLVNKHDADNRQGIKEFDLNNPPRKPLVETEYPRVVYDHKARKAKKVANEEELKAAQKAGWKTDPYPAQPPEPEPELADRESARKEKAKK